MITIISERLLLRSATKSYLNKCNIIVNQRGSLLITEQGFFLWDQRNRPLITLAKKKRGLVALSC